MALSHLTRDHVLDIIDYYPYYNCRAPSEPTIDTLMNEISEISTKIQGADDVEDAENFAKELDKLEGPDFSDFLEYHDAIYEKMDNFRSSIVNALDASGGVFESANLNELSVDQLIEMVENMRSELEEQIPYAGTVSGYISDRKIIPQFAEVLVSLGLNNSTLYPNIKRGEYECRSINPDIRVVWAGHALYVYRNGCVLNVTEDKIGMQQPGDKEYQNIMMKQVKKIFPDWTKPTKEQGDLFQMLYPNHQYNLDMIFGDI